MTKAKKERLEQIVSETNELHPLLESLFSKMPNINRVEYTHGSSEMAADFVLSLMNQTFGTIEHMVVSRVFRFFGQCPFSLIYTTSANSSVLLRS